MKESSSSSKRCSCCGANLLVFACSGASSVGHLSDLAAREIGRRGFARMGCLAGVAAQTPWALTALKETQFVVVLDGCPTECARRVIAQAGRDDAFFLRADALGMKRGETPVDEQHVHRLADAAIEAIGRMCQIRNGEMIDPCHS